MLIQIQQRMHRMFDILPIPGKVIDWALPFEVWDNFCLVDFNRSNLSIVDGDRVLRVYFDSIKCSRSEISDVEFENLIGVR